MAVRSPSLRCVLLGWTLAVQLLTLHCSRVSGSDLSPEEAGLTNLELRSDYSMREVLDVVAEMLHTGVRDITAHTHAEVLSRLDRVQSSLDAVAGLAARLEAVERLVNGLREPSAAASACQESLQETLSAISDRQDSLQTSLSDVISRQDALQRAVTDLSNGQKSAQQTLQALERQQNNMTDELTTLSGQLKVFSEQPPQGVEYLLDIVPTRQEVQQSLASQCRQDPNLSGVLTSLSQTQQALTETVSEQSVRLQGLADSLAILSDHQRDVQVALTGLPSRKYLQENIAALASKRDRMEPLEQLVTGQEKALQELSAHSGRLSDIQESLTTITSQQLSLPDHSSALASIGGILSSFPEWQRELQQALSAQSARLTSVAEVVALTPVPSGRPSLVTGRLLGEPCRSTADCSSLRADTVCGSDGRCRCADGLQPVAGEACRPYPRLTEPCRATSDCRGATELAVCADGLCGCPRGLFNFNGTECRSGLGIGEPCHRDADCPTLVGLVCAAGACAVRTCDSPGGGSSYQYRLVGGDSCSDGLLQFTFNSGQLWQYLCDSDWTPDDAAVACRSLGLSGGRPLPWNTTAAAEPNFFSVKDYVCGGSERSLSGCRRVYGRRDCAATELARVQCGD
ncbi:Macrophage receptor MARCO [Amphibalanus amphitrite]|uniref:Macrophage receptor MARCO n=1 Tax=Amphibalanus amphitrite TaxID=1232801 RepID=A0A6A4X245_AMPAM|nr:Macrophage receptor MARCO [Amphibalanus amphitrite]